MKRFYQTSIKIFKQDIQFSCAHFTIFSEKERERIHGHNYSVEIEFRENKKFENGILLDYKEIKTKLREICKGYDEMFLIPKNSKYLKIKENESDIEILFDKEKMLLPKRDVKLLPISNVTGEELSKLIYDQLKNVFQNESFSITISSNFGQSVSYYKKYLIITGGTKGIGKEIVNIFRENGYEIINISRSILENAINICLDLSNLDELNDKLKQLKIEKSKICLVHNAAVHPEDSIENFDYEKMKMTFDINVIAPSLINSKLIHKMNKGSSIIYIGSTLSEKAVSGRLSYVSSKHSIIGLMRSNVQDLFGKGIHTCVICPGFTETEMMKSSIKGSEIKFQEFLEEFVSYKRLVNPKEIGEIVYFASSNETLNGSIIHANLGQKEN